MNWFFKVLSSSIGKKFVMGITGLLLCGFLITHLAGNLLLYVGPKAFNEYAAALHSRQELLYVAEVGLFLLFVAHVYLAFSTNIENKLARKKSYAMKVNKYEGRMSPVAPDTWMFVSGAIVLGFVVLHIIDIRLGWRPDVEYPDVELGKYATVMTILTNPISRVVYFVGSIILALHVLHGFASAFQSLGLNHPKYNGLIRFMSLIFALVVGLGFASFPVLVTHLNQ